MMRWSFETDANGVRRGDARCCATAEPDRKKLLNRGQCLTGVFNSFYVFGWLGRKDSNLRMPESKSGALTSLATPQLSCNPIPQWVFSQSGASLNQPKPWMSGLLKTICFNSAAHCSGNFRFRQNGFGKFGVFGEQTRTRPRHTNMYSMFSKPPRCPENLRIKTVNHRLQIISAKIRSWRAWRLDQIPLRFQCNFRRRK